MLAISKGVEVKWSLLEYHLYRLTLNLLVYFSLISFGATLGFALFSLAGCSPVSHDNHILEYLQDYWSFKCILYLLIGYYKERTRRKHDQGHVVTQMCAERNETHHCSKLSSIAQNGTEEMIDCVEMVLKCVYHNTSFSIYSSEFNSLGWGRS